VRWPTLALESADHAPVAVGVHDALMWDGCSREVIEQLQLCAAPTIVCDTWPMELGNVHG
jgi:hypothetical protein